jgi:hypothetical protein
MKKEVSGGQADIFFWYEMHGRYLMIFIFWGGWKTSCGSASLKLCVWKAASLWSQGSFPGS